MEQARPRQTPKDPEPHGPVGRQLQPWVGDSVKVAEDPPKDMGQDGSFDALREELEIAAAKTQATVMPTGQEAVSPAPLWSSGAWAQCPRRTGLSGVGPSSARPPRSLICVPFPGSSESSEFSEEMSSGLER